MKTTTRTVALILTSAVVSAGATLLLARPAADVQAATAPPAGAPAVTARDRAGSGTVAGPGRVEPASEEIVVGGEISGRLRAVRVQEGDRIAAGQVLAEIEPAEYRARLDAARASLAIARAEEARLVNGARAEEREEARAAAVQAREVARQAEAERTRRERLFAEGVIPREEFERAVRDERVAIARHDEQAERARVVDAAARADELARARAAIDLAGAQVAEAEALLAKTLVRAPCDGVVLRRHRQPGENLGLLPSPTPIVTVADVSTLRVRVDVDETDIAGLRPGLAAWVTADAFGAKRFPGRVIRVGEMLGRTHIRTDQPSERIDHKVLEVLVELDASARLPVGLRVDAFIARP
jgi:multidrug resistance efflux pump